MAYSPYVIKGNKMQNRHLNAVMVALEAVRDLGFVEIRKSSLRTWYERERITKPVWRDIIQKWEDLGEASQLFLADLEGSFVIIDGNGLQSSSDARFQPINGWAEVEEKKKFSFY